MTIDSGERPGVGRIRARLPSSRSVALALLGFGLLAARRPGARPVAGGVDLVLARLLSLALPIALMAAGLTGSLAWAAPTSDPAEPTPAARPPTLQQRLDAALAAKGPDYQPRTEHLEPDGRPRFTNRLILQDSPYLLQHAHNPVDWFPWGPEAFEQARRENKLVFLSIGYSTCHWCHVMERESFEDLAIARLLNEHFIAIKVDREVHPDVDRSYMTAIELVAGRGGWPMSSILTPDGDTIDGGTYFPPGEFAELLERAQRLWHERPELLRGRALQIAEAVRRALATQDQAVELDDAAIDQAVSELLERHDELQGGFGQAPKFPREPQLALLLDQALHANNAAALEAVTFTLRQMARGGIHDQVGGGFHRYAIDNGWLVPHFEKMLYNQAQLATLYLGAWQASGEPEFAQVARRTLDFVLRDLTSPNGGFYSATDADSEGGEGRFFLWTPAEIRAALPRADAELAIRFHGVTKAGNFEGSNILHVPVPPAELAATEDLSEAALKQRLSRIHVALYRAREERPHPLRDNKILTGWNGMMIAALAKAGSALDEPRYLASAERSAELLWSVARPAPGALTRVYLDGRASQTGPQNGPQNGFQTGSLTGPKPGLLDDYAFLGLGMIALYDATAEPRWLERARELADALWSRFADADDGGLYMGEASGETPLMARPKDLSDTAMPSGNSAALHLLAALDRRTDDLRYGNRARELIGAVAARVRRNPTASASLLAAVNRLRHGDTGPMGYAARGAVRVHGRLEHAGDKPSLHLALEIKPSWHINAREPLQPELIPTRLRLAGDPSDWQIDALDYPSAQVLKLGFQREPLAVYQGRAQIRAVLSPTTEPANGSAAWLPVELQLQACSEDRCLPPETLRLQIPVPASR